MPYTNILDHGTVGSDADAIPEPIIATSRLLELYCQAFDVSVGGQAFRDLAVFLMADEPYHPAASALRDWLEKAFLDDCAASPPKVAWLRDMGETLGVDNVADGDAIKAFLVEMASEAVHDERA